MADALRWTIRLGGLLRGRELSGQAELTFEGDLIVVATPRERLLLTLPELEGMRVLGDSLELFLATGDAVVLEGPLTASLSAELSRHVYALPEMTRSLRGLGTRRATPGTEHDRFYAVLLEARRTGEHAPNWVALRAAFDADDMRSAFRRRLAEFASERYPHHASERRALEAELLECAAPLEAQLAALEREQQALSASDDAEKFARWRAWSASLQRVFERADECWLSAQEILHESRRARRGRVSRWFGRAR